MIRNNRLIRIVIKADTLWRKSVCILLILAALYLVSTIYDIYSLTQEGIGGLEYHSFRELLAINPDIAAWIRIDDTNIDHPVVQGKDNFEYLSKDINGNDYAGGSIFLDSKNKKDLSDMYIIIHGHHMSGGAMFGDLAKFNEEDFFESHAEGELLTPDSRYDLTITGVATVDAYDGSVYLADPETRPLELLTRCHLRRETAFDEKDKLLVLSTCSGDMSNNRTVVFAKAHYAGKNDE